MISRRVVLTALSASRIFGANSRVRMGLIGCGGRGRYVASFMKEAGNVDFVAVADVWKMKAESARTWAGEAKEFSDFRRLLETRDLDGVLVATPDHWHSMPAILAARAGKHVYVEKPLAYSIAEGRAIADAAGRTRSIVTIGTQQRSAEHFPEVAEMIRSGQLGRIRYVRVWNFTNMTGEGIGKEPDGPVPAGVDWDMYVGPAPMRPFNRLRLGPTYRWFWDYAGGTITDFGVHRFDTVHQILGIDERERPGPLRVSAMGQRFEASDAREMPDVLQVTYDYGDFVMSYEASNLNGHGLGGRTSGMRYYNSRGELDRPHGMAFYGTEGAVFCDRIGYETYPEPVPLSGQWKPSAEAGAAATSTARMAGSRFEPKFERRMKNVTDATRIHAQRFIAAIRDGAPNPAPVRNGHRATNVGHLGNIAYRTGASLTWDPVKETIGNAPEAGNLLARTARAPWNPTP